MKRAALYLLIAMLAACASFSRSSNDAAADADADALARAETSFAAMSSSSGVKAAFLDALGDDAMLFRPGPVNGKTFMAARPDPAIVLDWRPQRVCVAASGELGYSTGPWKLTSKKDASAVQYGQFFTVWRKNAEGRWQVLIDHGISHSGSIGWGAPLEKIAIDRGPWSGERITAAEARFSVVSDSEGLTAAYRAFGSRYIRVLRDEEAPIDGMAAMNSATMSSSSAPARWTWASTDSGTARSSDLAWTMGRYRARDAGNSTNTGYYVRVWRAEGGTWKILSDVLAPIEDPAR